MPVAGIIAKCLVTAKKRCWNPIFALNERWFIGPRQVQKIVKQVAERARISQNSMNTLRSDRGLVPNQLPF